MLTETDRYILAGRLKHYLGRSHEAVELFSEGLERSPDEPRLLRHRGHRFITLRDFGRAVADLETAARVTADMPDEHEYFQPETEADVFALILEGEGAVRPQRQAVTAESVEAAKGSYKSTLKVSIHYHLAIAHYLLGAFAAAHENFERGAALSVDDDMKVANADWSYMSLRRLGRRQEAEAVIADFDTDAFDVNPQEDFYLQRLRLYRGQLGPDALLARHAEDPLAFATQGYGVANWHLYHGRHAEARQLLAEVVERGNRHCFGYLAAEVDLQRMSTGNTP